MSTTKLVHPPVLWAMLSLGILTHSLFLALDHSYYAIDTPSYLVPADSLLHEHKFVNSLHQPELSRTPGYPMLLALFRIKPLKVEYLILLQHILCVLIVGALAAVAFRITGSRLIAAASSSVLALDLATLVVANELLSETLFTVVIVLMCWILYQAAQKERGTLMRVAAAGLMGGYAVLIRPVGVLYFIPIVIYLYLTLRRRSFRPILVFTTSFLLIPLVWSARNYTTSGYFGISTIGAHNLLAYRAAGALAVQQPGDYPANALKAQQLLMNQACQGMEHIYGRECSQISETQQAEYSARMGTNIILHNIPSYAKSAFIGLGYIVFGGGAEVLSHIGKLNPRLAKLVVLLISIPEACLAIVGCWFWFRRERTLFYLLVLTVAYFLMISAGGEAYSRFRVPVMPMYALLVGGGVAAVVREGQPISTTWEVGRAKHEPSTELHPVSPRAEKSDDSIRGFA